MTSPASPAHSSVRAAPFRRISEKISRKIRTYHNCRVLCRSRIVKLSFVSGGTGGGQPRLAGLWCKKPQPRGRHGVGSASASAPRLTCRRTACRFLQGLLAGRSHRRNGPPRYVVRKEPTIEWGGLPDLTARSSRATAWTARAASSSRDGFSRTSSVLPLHVLLASERGGRMRASESSRNSDGRKQHEFNNMRPLVSVPMRAGCHGVCRQPALRASENVQFCGLQRLFAAGQSLPASNWSGPHR